MTNTELLSQRKKKIKKAWRGKRESVAAESGAAESCLPNMVTRLDPTQSRSSTVSVARATVLLY